MRQLLLGLLLIASVAFGAEVLKVGAVLPLTGNASAFGQSVKNALIMADEDVSRSTDKRKIVLVFEDDEGTPSRCVMASRKLMDLDHADVVISLWSTDVPYILPTLEKHHKLHLSECWDVAAISKSPISFAISYTPRSYAQSCCKIIQKLGCKRVALVGSKEAGWDLATKASRQQAINCGLKIVSDQEFTSEAHDFRTAILKAQQAKPDIYFVNLSYPVCDIFIKQLKELSDHPRVTGYLDVVSDSTLLNGQYYPTGYANLPAFYERYKNRWHESGEQTPAPYAYDTMQMLHQVSESLNTWDTDAAVKKFESLKNFKGVIGTLNFEFKHFFGTPFYFIRVENGQKHYVDLSEVKP